MLHRLPESTLCSGSGHRNGSKAACRPYQQRRGLPRAPYSQRISCLHNAEGAEPTRKPAVNGLYNILEKPATIGSEHGEVLSAVLWFLPYVCARMLAPLLSQPSQYHQCVASYTHNPHATATQPVVPTSSTCRPAQPAACRVAASCQGIY